MKQKMTAVLTLSLLLLSGCESMPEYMTQAELAERAAEAGISYDPVFPTESETITEVDASAERVIPPAEEIDGEVLVQDGILLVNSGTDHVRAMELFQDHAEAGVQYAEVLNRYRAMLSEYINVFCMMIPTAAAYYTPEEMAEEYDNQAEAIETIASHLSGVTNIPLYEPLLYHRDQPIYSRTDHYWQPLGAYYAAAELAAVTGVSYPSLEGYDQVDREGYTGDFLTVDHISELDNAPEIFTYYRPANLDMLNCYVYDTDFTNSRVGKMFNEDTPVSSSYEIFIGMDNCIFRTDTDVENNRVLVIFKDSYGNALLPFLTGSYAAIYLCDFRYLDTDAVAFVENVGATDVVFAMSTMTCATPMKVNVMEETFINRHNSAVVSE